LLLDEATSALDKQNELAVQESINGIRKELGGITTIVIAHRLTTVKDADEIIVVKAGRIEEKGTYDGLIAKGGLFAELVNKQNGVANDSSPSKIPEGDRDDEKNLQKLVDANPDGNANPAPADVSASKLN